LWCIIDLQNMLLGFPSAHSSSVWVVLGLFQSQKPASKMNLEKVRPKLLHLGQAKQQCCHLELKHFRR